jgi:gliding motility-associated-like protein
MNFLKFSKLFLFRTSVLFVLNILSVVVLAQNACDFVRSHEADNWLFGSNAILNFNQNEPSSSGTPWNIDFFVGSSAISDEEGNLLFFSDGKTLYGDRYNVIDNSGSLFGDIGSPQSSIFLPAPGNKDKYYFFTLQNERPNFIQGLYSTVIEKVNSSWTVPSDTKNQLIYMYNSQKITAVKQKNQKDYWVIIHGFGEDIENQKFLFYSLTENGLDTQNPEVVEIGARHSGSPVNTKGFMKTSPDGSKIAIVLPENNMVQLFDLNIDNQISLTNERTIDVTIYFNPFGLEFSPDSKMLYISTTKVNSTNYLLQYNLTTSQLEVVLNRPYSTTDHIGALQLGVDGRIYGGNFGSSLQTRDSLIVINNPNRAGVDCNINRINQIANNGLVLVNSHSRAGLPNFVTSFLDIPHFSWINQCATEITYFNLRNETNVGTPSWVFGYEDATSNDLRSNYIYTLPGKYTVKVTENFGGNTYPYKRDITIHPVPPVELGDPVLYILPGSSITLDAGEFDEYLWDPDGSTDRYLDVSQEGIYKVTVTDTNCCVNEDQIEIKLAKIYFPTAFKPTSSVVENSSFKCLGDISAMLNFNMKIFNRWGQMVFSSDDPDKGWDGTFSGGDAEAGVYVWVINYSSTESRYQTAQSSSQRGTVTLLR